MTVAHRGEPVRVVVACVALVADPDGMVVEDAHRCREHACARQPLLREIALHLGADTREGHPEHAEPAELGVIPGLPEPRMVPVLLAAAVVSPGGLQVTLGVRADPYVGPRGRNDQCLDPTALPGISYGLAGWSAIAPSSTALVARDAGLVAGHVTQPRHLGDEFWIRARARMVIFRALDQEQFRDWGGRDLFPTALSGPSAGGNNCARHGVARVYPSVRFDSPTRAPTPAERSCRAAWTTPA